MADFSLKIVLRTHYLLTLDVASPRTHKPKIVNESLHVRCEVEKNVWIHIRWLHQKPSDLDLHSLKNTSFF